MLSEGVIMSDKRILVVDDAAFMRMMLKDIFVKNGFIVCGEAQDGYEAIEKYRALKPDIVIMDINMPNMDGPVALQEILKEFPDAKIVMCSAMGQESHLVEAIKAGAVEFITKPFHADRIISTVTKVLK